jgi:segregation and condensation protein A
MLAALHNETYQVRLPVFEGPLDLLLHLIEREKLDISTVSLAQIADQFLEYVRSIETVQPGTLADFLVMAARLVYIKSRLLLPQPANTESGEEEEDPGEALARQLREYKRFRDAAQALRVIEERGLHSYLRVAGPPELERRLEGGDATLADLLAAAHAAFTVQPPKPPVGTVVSPFTITIHDQIRLIAQATAGNRPVIFSSLLRYMHNRVETIVTLQAVLELLKRHQVQAEQSRLFGEIVIQPIEGVEISTVGIGANENQSEA